jgi:hypothetical protein
MYFIPIPSMLATDVKNLILFRFLFQFFQIFVAEIEQKVSEQFRQSPKAMKTMGMMKKQISEKIMAIREMAKMTAKGDKVDSAKGAREDHHVHNKHHKSPSEQLEHFEGNVLAQIKFNFVIHGN